MKKFILFMLLCMISALHTNAQEQKYDCFKIENGKVIWQAIYDSPRFSSDKLMEYFKIFQEFENVREVYKNTIAADLNSVIDWKALGFKGIEVPFYLKNTLLQGTVVIQFKEGKYRVSVYNMKFPINDIESTVVYKLEANAFQKDKNEFSEDFYKGGAEVIDALLNSIFTVLPVSVLDDNW